MKEITANDTLSVWLNRQHEAVKRGAVAKLYYKATPQGLKPYKYIEKQGDKKIIILIGEESKNGAF